MFEAGGVAWERAAAGGVVGDEPGLDVAGLDCLVDEADELDLDFLANGKLTRRGDRILPGSV
jgi:hypothetical protein